MSAYLLNLATATALGNAIAFHDDETVERVVAQAKELYIKALAPGSERSQWSTKT